MTGVKKIWVRLISDSPNDSLCPWSYFLLKCRSLGLFLGVTWCLILFYGFLRYYIYQVRNCSEELQTFFTFPQWDLLCLQCLWPESSESLSYFEILHVSLRFVLSAQIRSKSTFIKNTPFWISVLWEHRHVCDVFTTYCILLPSVAFSATEMIYLPSIFRWTKPAENLHRLFLFQLIFRHLSDRRWFLQWTLTDQCQTQWTFIRLNFSTFTMVPPQT